MSSSVVHYLYMLTSQSANYPMENLPCGVITRIRFLIFVIFKYILKVKNYGSIYHR